MNSSGRKSPMLDVQDRLSRMAGTDAPPPAVSNAPQPSTATRVNFDGILKR